MAGRAETRNSLDTNRTPLIATDETVINQLILEREHFINQSSESNKNM
jgi:hypothetical protein